MPGDKTEILIVDDSATIRATIAKFLGDEYTTYTANDGEEGWQLLQANDAISLVFTDMHMPVMNGMLFLQRIRESDCERIANLPVIMITGHDDTEAAKRATHNIGATDFLSKPFDKIDILSRVKSYTSLNNRITELTREAAHDVATGLYNNRMLMEFGNKTLSFGKRHNMATAMLYVEVADIQQYRDGHGARATETIIAKVADVLESSVRKEELVSHLDEARFAIVLPNTKTFKAHIVATRLKQSVESLVFEINNVTVRISLAVGISSTQDLDGEGGTDFEQCCTNAAHALTASLETPNHRITRYDETYEKRMSDESDAHAPSPAKPADPGDDGDKTYEFSTPDISEEVADDQASADAFGDYFSCILTGEFSKIPAEFLPSMIEPLEDFLEYAHSTINDRQKISGEH